MSGMISVLAVGAAFSAALLLVFAGFDAPVRASAEPHPKSSPTPMRTVRECGLWCALFALLGAYIVALT
jgi:hypothetical protein